MNKQEGIILGFFFTYGVSLQIWKEKGLLSREIKLYNELAKEEAIKKIFFFTYGDETEHLYKKMLNSKIEIVIKPKKYYNKNYSFLLPIIHKNKLKECTLLKTNQMDGAWTAVLAKLLYQKKLIVRTGYCWSITLKHLNKRRKWSWAKIIERIVYWYGDVAIVTSNRDKQYVEQKYGFKKTVLIPNYVDTEIFFPENKSKKQREICFVGRLSKEKNLYMLIDALEGTNVGVTFIGSGEERQHLEKYAKEKDVKVIFKGFVANEKIPSILNEYSVFVLPSHFEGNPKALLEAMACGLCVIGTNVEGIKEIVVNKQTGLLCEKNTFSLKEAILFCLKEKKVREVFGKRARDFIKRRYSLKSIIDAEEKTYVSLL